ncbi:MAG: AAA family ATPase, partial [Chloroflexota bacterium]|nr:AAA family ATPase [Chloroflexota bacterium]
CEPLHEVAVQRLMRLYLAAGRREEAIHAYETFSIRLAQELKVQPTPEIRALADRIRRETPPHFAPAVRQFSHNASACLESPLIGRAQQYAQLVESYYATCQGQFRLVLVEGEAGIGKTRLVTDFLNWVSGQDADVLRGQCYETGGHLPYQPLVDAFRTRLEQENAPEDLLTDIWLTELSRLLPELRDRYPDLPQPLTDEVTTKTRLHEAVVRLGQALSRRAPLVLWLDDVQWADAATLDLLRTLGQRFLESGSAALLIVSMRSEGLIATPAPGAWVSGLERDLPMTRLVLGPLTYEDTLQLVQAVLLPAAQREGGRTRSTVHSLSPYLSSSSEQFSRWLFNETQGQPLYISETFKALLERKVLTFTMDADGQRVIDMAATVQQIMVLNKFLPAGVRNVIRARLTQLTPAALALLIAGAVLGHGFSFESLRQVAGIGEDEALQALDEVVLRNLLQEGIEEGSIYYISHDKVRDVIYAEAGDARRRILHRRAFKIFQQALDSSPVAPAVLAYHALAAGLFIDAFQ